MDSDDMAVQLSSRGSFLRSGSTGRGQQLLCELLSNDAAVFGMLAVSAGLLATCDDRRRVFVFNFGTGKYKALALSAGPPSVTMTAIAFVQGSSDELIVGFSNQAVVVLNWRVNRITTQLQSPRTVHGICTLSTAVFLTLENRDVVLIDLKSRRLLRELRGSEHRMHVNVLGAYVSVLSAEKGLTMYTSDTFRALAHTTMEGDAHLWLSCCQFPLAPSDHRSSACSLLLDKSGALHVWSCNLDKLRDAPLAASDLATAIAPLGSLQLPPHLGDPLKIVYAGHESKTRTHFMAVLTSEGRVLVVSACLLGARDLAGAKWGVTAMRRFTPSAADGASDLAYVESEDRRFLCAMVAGRVFVLRLVPEELCTQSQRAVFRPFVSATVFTIPSAETENADIEIVRSQWAGAPTARSAPRARSSADKDRRSPSLSRAASRKPSALAHSLYELATLKSKEKRLNTDVLAAFIRSNGVFPEKYRPLIWRFLLRLPENVSSFASLSTRGLHPSYSTLQQRFPVKPEKVFERLQRVCSMLAHWSAIFAEVTYLPNIVFPFLLVFGSDELAGVETVMTLFLWWGHSWFSTFPNPPLNVMDAMSEFLLFHDKPLYSHMTKTLDANPGLVGWGMISSLFTEVLGKQEWFKIMDFLFVHLENSVLILLLPIAIIREVRSSIMELPRENSRLFESFFHQNLVIDADRVIALAKTMLRTTPKSKFSVDVNENMDAVSGGKATELSNTERLRRNMATDKGAPVFPLPKGHYPLFNGYPLTQKDGELNERSKLVAHSNLLTERKNVIEGLEEKLKEYDDEHMRWVIEQKEQLAAEHSAKERYVKAEKKHLDELLRVEEEISEKRVEAMLKLEAVAKREAAVVQELQARKAKDIGLEDQIQSHKQAYEIKVAKLRSIADEAEQKLQEKLRVIYSRRGSVDPTFAHDKRAEVRAAQSSITNTDSFLSASFGTQDLSGLHP